MGYAKDFYKHNLYVRWRYWPRELLSFRNWKNLFKYRHQRAERGWCDRDTWGGGEYLASVAEGILRYLEDVQNVVDWEAYFRTNYDDIDYYGYKSLTEVADDLELYLWWEVEQWDDKFDGIESEDRWAIDNQLYSQLQNAMHFIAENVGHLWW